MTYLKSQMENERCDVAGKLMLSRLLPHLSQSFLSRFRRGGPGGRERLVTKRNCDWFFLF
jgi:hypothetical protein